jgi:hypothetical protein
LFFFTISSNEGCLEVIATGKKSILSFLDSVCIRPGVEERVFLSLLHTNIKKHPFFPSTKSIDKKEKFKVKHFARTVTYTVGSFIPKNMDIKLTGLEELLETSSFYTSSKCTLFAGSNTPVGRSRSGSDASSLTPPPSPTPVVEASLQSVVPQRRGSVGLTIKHRTVGGTFITQMANLSKLLESTNCSFVRCIKPNNTMTNGLFDPHCVVNQLRCLGIVQTCEVLKVGLPTRIKISEIEEMFRPILPQKLYDQLHRLKPMDENPSFSFIQALMWACQIPSDSFRIGRTRVFFKSGKIAMLSEVMSQTDDAGSGNRLTHRLSFYITRIYFRKWMTRFMCENAWLSQFEKSRDKLQAVWTIQKAWKGYFYSVKRLRRKTVRRKWRVAILKVRCCSVFMQEIQLQVDANEMRVSAQAKAAAQIERQEAELQLLLDQEEAEMMVEFEEQLVKNRKLSEGGEEELEPFDEGGEGGGGGDDEEDPFSLALEDDDEFPTDFDEFSRTRSQSTGTRSRNNSVGRSNSLTTRRGSLGAGGGGGVGAGSMAQRNASIANFGNSSAGSIAKSEMQALIAASSLATVSVCLFRWQNIKKFSAFETWFDNVTAEYDDDDDDGKKLKKRTSSVLSRASSITFDKRHSLHEIHEVEDEEKDEKESGTDVMLEKEPEPPALDEDAENIANCAPITRQTSSIAKMFSSVGTDNEDESDFEGSGTPTSRRSETDSPLEGGLAQDLCFECSERTPVLYCMQCVEEYCKVCSQFVHDYCKHMKTHKVVDLSKKPLGVVQMQPSFSSHNITETSPAAAPAPTPAPVMETPVPLRKVSISAEIKTDEGPQRRASRTFKTMGMITSDEGGSQKNHCAIRSCDKPATKGVSIRFCDEHYDEFRNGMKISKQHDEEEGETDAKTLQQTIALLTKQLKESGQQPVEFVELCVARERMQKAVERLMGGEEAAENDIERWDKAIKMNPDYQIEMEEKARKWEEDQRPLNHACYLRMRRLIPPDLHAASLGSMIEDGLPKTIANRIWTKKILGMICTHEGDIKRIHIVDLQTKYSNQGLDIVEMRAIWYVMPTEFDLDGDGKKAKWRDLFRQKLEELTVKEEGKRLSNPEKRNNAYKGHDELSIYDPATEIKKKVIAKSTAFDATEKPDISQKLGSGIKELRKQMGPEKPLMDGPLLYLSGGSDNPDEGKKVYANLFRQKKTIKLYPNADKAKEDQDCIEEVPIIKGYSLKLGPGSKTFCLMEGDKEAKAFQSDKARREAWSTALNDVITLANTVKKVKKKEKEKVVEEEAAAAADERPPRPSFLDAIGKKGGGGGGGERPPAPSFMDAIKNKKKAGGGGEGGGEDRPAPPSFMDAIKNRKKPALGGDEKPAAPSFMDAIKNRKKAEGGGGGGGGGERPAPPSFMDAIKNRKKKKEEEEKEKEEKEGIGTEKKTSPPSFLDAIAKRNKDKDSEGEGSGSGIGSEKGDSVKKKVAKVRKEEEI